MLLLILFELLCHIPWHRFNNYNNMYYCTYLESFSSKPNTDKKITNVYFLKCTILSLTKLHDIINCGF